MNSGGKERQLYYLIKELSRKNDIQLILFNEKIFYKEIFELSIQTYIFPQNQKYKLKTLIKLFQVIREFKPQVVHSWDNIATLLSMPFLIFYPKVKLISSIRYAGKLKNTFKRSLIKKITRIRSSAVVSNSKRGLEVENLLNKPKGVVIHNGLDLYNFDANVKNTVQTLNSLNRFKMKVAMVGRFYRAKDYITFIKAAKMVLQENKDICFICVGDGPLRSKAEMKAGRFLNKNIFLLGNRNDIPFLLYNTDIGVLLNNINGHAEGISNAIMEYMAAELPVIATNAGGTPELVKDNISGFLVPAFDENVVAEKILYLINNQNRAREMGKAGRIIIEKDFSIKQMTESYLNLYERLIHEK